MKGGDNENMASSSTLDDTEDTEDLEVYPLETVGNHGSLQDESKVLTR